MKDKVIKKWYDAMHDVWSEISNGNVKVEKIKLTKFQHKWNIGYVPRETFLPYVTKTVAPSLEDARELHDEALAYYKRRLAAKAREEELKVEEPKVEELTEERCVQFLLDTGHYKIMRKDWVEVSANQ